MNYLALTTDSKICRTCLVSDSPMKSVFNYEEVMGNEIMLCDMLMSCASIFVLREDELPKNICLNCIRQVNTAYLFKKLCERSDATLRESSSITTLNSNHSNIFSSQIECNKFNIGSEYKLLNQHEYDENQKTNTESDNYCKTLTGEPVDQDQHYLDDSDVDEIILKQNRNNFPADTFQTNIAQIAEAPVRCQHCGKDFHDKKFLTHHMLVHKNSSTETKKHRNRSGVLRKRNQPRTCDICNKTFRFHSNLERHKLTHTGEKPFLCNVCGKGFAQMAYLKIHSFTHTGEKPYKCRTCDRSFAAPGTLMTHVRTHTGERPHICKICGKDFPQSGYLSAHIRTHTGEKPIECKVCNRRFNQSGRLIIHMRIHSGEKPYQCTMCSRSFAVKGTLKKHIRTHTGEKPYKCKVCGQAFAQSGTLTTHAKIHKSKAEVESSVPWT